MNVHLNEDELIKIITALKIVVNSPAIDVTPSDAHDLLKLRDKLMQAWADR